MPLEIDKQTKPGDKRRRIKCVTVCAVVFGIAAAAAVLAPTSLYNETPQLEASLHQLPPSPAESSPKTAKRELTTFAQSSKPLDELSPYTPSTASVPVVAASASKRVQEQQFTLERINPLRPYLLLNNNKFNNTSASDSKHRLAELEQEDLLKGELAVGFRCPPFRYPKGKSADSHTIQEAMHKYSRYTHQYCNTTGVLQMQVPFELYTNAILTKIAAMVGLKKGDRILDFGSGCGTMLNYFHLKYGTIGIGIDVTEDAVKFANQHRQDQNLFCLLNAATQLVVKEDIRSHYASPTSNVGGETTTERDEGRGALQLAPKSYFEPNSLDSVVSWGVLHHIRRTMSQCMIIHNIVKLLKPGAKAFIGHLRHDKGDYWRKGKCKVSGANIKRMRDGNTFHVGHWKKYDFGSLYIHKLENVSDTE